MNTAHTLFHHDSRHLLRYLHHDPTERREHSLVLCTALMRAAGLDLNEQGDVWARITQQRAQLLTQRPDLDQQQWQSFTRSVRHLLLGTASRDAIEHDWLTAFTRAGRTLHALRSNGDLTRGIRAVIALHVIFHWNRIGIPAATQATLTQAARDAILNTDPPPSATGHPLRSSRQTGPRSASTDHAPHTVALNTEAVKPQPASLPRGDTQAERLRGM